MLAIALNPSCWFNLANSKGYLDTPEHLADIADLRNQIQEIIDEKRRINSFLPFIDSLDLPEEPKEHDDLEEVVELPTPQFDFFGPSEPGDPVA